MIIPTMIVFENLFIDKYYQQSLSQENVVIKTQMD